MNDYNSIGGVNANPIPFNNAQDLNVLNGKIYTVTPGVQPEVYNSMLASQNQVGVFQQAATFVMGIISQAFQMFKGLIGHGAGSTAINSMSQQGQNTELSWSQILREALPSLIGNIFGPVGGAFGGLVSKAGGLIKKLF